MSAEAKKWLVDKTCNDRNYGARPLRRALQRHVEAQLADAMIVGELKNAVIVEVFLNGDKLDFRVALEKQTEQTIEEILKFQ